MAIVDVGVRQDPLLGYNFLVNLIDSSSSLAMAQSAAASAVLNVALGGFSECDGLEMTLEIEEYNEGGRNGRSLIFPTRVKWSHITLKKGLAVGSELWNWHYGFVNGTGKRRDGIIVLQDDLRLPRHTWIFRRGLPVKYTGPSLNAGQSEVAVESIEIAHEGLYQFPLGS